MLGVVIGTITPFPGVRLWCGWSVTVAVEMDPLLSEMIGSLGVQEGVGSARGVNSVVVL